MFSEFFFIRHGETDWNKAGRLQGQTDIPLNDLGRRQAADAGRSLAKLLRRRNIADLDRLAFVASPLGRARETMEIARSALGLPIRDYSTDERLKELRFGDWEGLTWPEVKLRAPDAYRARKTSKWIFVPPGDADSYDTLRLRLLPWLETLKPNSVVVAHGGVCRALMVEIAGVDPLVAPDVDIWQGRVLTFAGGRCHWD